jgi:4'-phosphopantetheinyl transferase EntD
MSTSDPALQRSIEGMAVPGILIRHRVITEGDELGLLPEERDAFANSVVKVRRASGAARIVARELLSGLGKPRCAIPRSNSGRPIWPSGFTGSLAHDAEIAIAAVALERDFLGVGVDVEPAEALEPELLPLIATANERKSAPGDPRYGRLLFAIKEAVYKAVNPIDGRFLGHHDVDVGLEAGTAIVQQGRIVPFRFCIATHIVALAFLIGPSEGPA